MKKKLEQLKRDVAAAFAGASAPALFLSFGKDSMLLLHLLLEQQADFTCVWFDRLADKRLQAFAREQIARHNLRVYTPPLGDSFYARAGRQLYLVEGYTVNRRIIPALVLVQKGDKACGVTAAQKPPVSVATPAFDTALMGSKRTDKTGFGLAPRPLVEYEGLRIRTPLWEWTNGEVWRVIRQLGVETDAAQYERKEYDADAVNLCTRCVTRDGLVFCPQQGRAVRAVDTATAEKTAIVEQLMAA